MATKCSKKGVKSAPQPSGIPSVEERVDRLERIENDRNHSTMEMVGKSIPERKPTLIESAERVHTLQHRVNETRARLKDAENEVIRTREGLHALLLEHMAVVAKMSAEAGLSMPIS
jgi:succinate dehydrogenase/fumarate reductase flavoprotein subunit